MPVVRNASVPNDLNDFEIVTRNSLITRKNNRRSDIAVDKRKRLFYQVGVASPEGFTKTAIEFSYNNKIPLFSLKGMMSQSVINSFKDLTDAELNNFSQHEKQNLYDFFKDRDGDLSWLKYEVAKELLTYEGPLADIVTAVNTKIRFVSIGVLETGDLLFLYTQNSENQSILKNNMTLEAEIHWWVEKPSIWVLTIYDPKDHEKRIMYEFYLPEIFFKDWEKYNHDKAMAIKMKEDFFSKIFYLQG